MPYERSDRIHRSAAGSLRSADADERRRAELTIEFYKLNERDGLLEARADVITTLTLARSELSGGASAPVAQAIATRLVASSTPHANCARSFTRLWEADEQRARELATEALGLAQ